MKCENKHKYFPGLPWTQTNQQLPHSWQNRWSVNRKKAKQFLFTEQNYQVLKAPLGHGKRYFCTRTCPSMLVLSYKTEDIKASSYQELRGWAEVQHKLKLPAQDSVNKTSRLSPQPPCYLHSPSGKG